MREDNRGPALVPHESRTVHIYDKSFLTSRSALRLRYLVTNRSSRALSHYSHTATAKSFLWVWHCKLRRLQGMFEANRVSKDENQFYLPLSSTSLLVDTRVAGAFGISGGTFRKLGYLILGSL